MLVIIVGLGYTTFLLLNHQEAEPLTVSELKSKAESLQDQQLRVKGRVVPGSIDWDDKNQIMRFVLTDDKETLNIVYPGFVYDNFKPGAESVMVGRYGPDGVFEAQSFGQPNSLCSFCH